MLELVSGTNEILEATIREEVRFRVGVQGLGLGLREIYSTP